jgi:hypothetical protein
MDNRIIQNDPDERDREDILDMMRRDAIYRYACECQKRDKKKKAIREWLILIISVGTFIGSACLLLNLWEYIPENIMSKLGPLDGGVCAVFVLFGSSGLVVLALTIFDKIYNRIVD